MWTLQPFYKVAGRPWLALREYGSDRPQRFYTGFEDEIAEVTSRMHISARQLPAIDEEAFYETLPDNNLHYELGRVYVAKPSSEVDVFYGPCDNIYHHAGGMIRAMEDRLRADKAPDAVIVKFQKYALNLGAPGAKQVLRFVAGALSYRLMKCGQKSPAMRERLYGNRCHWRGDWIIRQFSTVNKRPWFALQKYGVKDHLLYLQFTGYEEDIAGIVDRVKPAPPRNVPATTAKAFQRTLRTHGLSFELGRQFAANPSHDVLDDFRQAYAAVESGPPSGAKLRAA